MIKITEVKSNKDRKQFITFQRKLYQGHPYYVPPLDRMEKDFFSAKNPMAQNCISCLWIAKENGIIKGRIAGIINHNYNKINKVKQARFSHFDCIEDVKVAHTLLRTATLWAKEQGSKEIIGPFGFTNLDKHGMLVEGFNELSCQSSNYNFPYYPKMVESFGFRKKHDWVERRINISDKLPEKVTRLAQVVKEKSGLSIIDLTSKRDMKHLASPIFDLYNRTYAHLYGVSPLSEDQKEALIKSFLPLLQLDFVSVIADKKGHIVAFGVAMPSLSESLQKANGHLFPTGFFHLLRSSKNTKTLDLLLIGIHPDYQRKGLNAIIFNEFFKGIKKNKIEVLETTQNLEDNQSIQNLWEAYDSRLHKRARLYRMEL